MLVYISFCLFHNQQSELLRELSPNEIIAGQVSETAELNSGRPIHLADELKIKIIEQMVEPFDISLKYGYFFQGQQSLIYGSHSGSSHFLSRIPNQVSKRPRLCNLRLVSKFSDEETTKAIRSKFSGRINLLSNGMGRRFVDRITSADVSAFSPLLSLTAEVALDYEMLPNVISVSELLACPVTPNLQKVTLRHGYSTSETASFPYLLGTLSMRLRLEEIHSYTRNPLNRELKEDEIEVGALVIRTEVTDPQDRQALLSRNVQLCVDVHKHDFEEKSAIRCVLKVKNFDCTGEPVVEVLSAERWLPSFYFDDEQIKGSSD